MGMEPQAMASNKRKLQEAMPLGQSVNTLLFGMLVNAEEGSEGSASEEVPIKVCGFFFNFSHARLFEGDLTKCSGHPSL